MEIIVPWLPGKIWAITLWPFILFRRGYETECIRKHERYHYKQAQRWLVIPWYLAYIVLQLFYFRKPANQHPLEKEAYRIQRECERESG